MKGVIAPDDGAFKIEAARARRRLPRLFADYLDGGAHGEKTILANRAAFTRWSLLPRGLRDVSCIDQKTTCFGMALNAPVLLSPVGFAGLFHSDGEIGAARAAERCGIASALSSFSIHSLEEVATVKAPLMAQLYILRDRGVTQDMLDRAAASGVGTLVLTIDTAITPLRPRDIRNGFRNRVRPSLGQSMGLARHPAWLLDRLRATRNDLGTMGRYTGARGIMAQARDIASRIDPALSWADLETLRACWKGRLVLKGVLHPDDARQAVSCGVDGLILSNHGGRQLDPAPSPLTMLPEILDVTQDRLEVVLDGGVRHGGDVVTALALGARAVSLGRPWAWALAAAGTKGIETALQRLIRETADCMALTGLCTIRALREAGRTALHSAG
ncbi:alpha-hydroxy acid oxidase [Asaia lannensis]|uniref:Alpha-hydroxy-acid oxidizing protein n=1 Tax=Asaia lannensis NBRC 102526 TaxID=1307926 RepID=A0ABT1CEK2_9PROT|nr:alpha-hydroxy acid oxidase [Asaia lannensis]MCO6158459.1 alpha-hydroxy-acid oxidizing protein [Asaia lannensis NBRC 102526]GBR01179.1 oxidoreductase [Asaia lannensis NBRC 102526]